MTLANQLLEANEIKTLILAAIKDNASAGQMLSYTTNGTKIVYEGATKSYDLLKRLNAEIQTIESNQSQLCAIT